MNSTVVTLNQLDKDFNERLDERLDEYKENDIVGICVDYYMTKPSGIVVVTSLLRNKLDQVEMSVYNPLIGTTVILVSGCDKFPDKLKTFLESTASVSYTADEDRRVLLTVDVKAKIDTDVKLFLLAHSKNHYSLARNIKYAEQFNGLDTFISDTSASTSMACTAYYLYMQLRNVTNTENYNNLMSALKYASYGTYFGMYTDLDTAKVNYYIENAKNKTDSIESRWKTKFHIDVRNIVQVQKLFSNISGKQITNVSRKNMYRLLNTEPLLVDLLKERIEYFNFVKLQSVMPSMCNKSFSIGWHKQITYIRHPRTMVLSSSMLDCIHTDEKKYYYVSIDGDQMQYKYAEKTLNNVDIKDNDYHYWTASILFNKPIKDVSKQERTIAKAVNFYRMYKNSVLKDSIDVADSMCKQYNYDILSLEKMLPPIYTFNETKFSELLTALLKRVYCAVSCFSIPDFTLSSVYFGEYIFKVSNKINPYRAMKILVDCFDTTGDIGIRLYDTCRIGTSYKDMFGFNDGVHADIPINKVNEGFSAITQEKVRNIVNYVYKNR